QHHESGLFLLLLATGWLVVSDELRLKILENCEIARLSLADLRRFKNAVESLQHEQSISLELSYASCLRRLGEHDTAWAALEKLIQHTGLEGDFETQTLARYEMALIFQHRAYF